MQPASGMNEVRVSPHALAGQPLSQNQNKTRKSVNHPATSGCYQAEPQQGLGWRMLRNGNYSAWYRTSLREGAGVVELKDGKLTGSDPILAYTGTYFQNGDLFSASLTTRRHTPGHPSVFGVDEIDLTLTGKSTPTTASCTGTAKQAPELTFEAVLIRMTD